MMHRYRHTPWLLAAATAILLTAFPASIHAATTATRPDTSKDAAAASASTAPAAAGCNHDTKLVLYWGQNSYGSANPSDKPNWEGRLIDYCRSGKLGTAVLSFMHIFGNGLDKTQVNFANHCPVEKTLPGTQLLDCPELREDVKACQELGVK
ncbi:hypothetical protein SYNPS1DRAFT_28001, partial [Syncephalis pseudoplumigaleata]